MKRVPILLLRTNLYSPKDLLWSITFKMMLATRIHSYTESRTRASARTHTHIRTHGDFLFINVYPLLKLQDSAQICPGSALMSPSPLSCCTNLRLNTSTHEAANINKLSQDKQRLLVQRLHDWCHHTQLRGIFTLEIVMYGKRCLLSLTCSC